jgi:hypothetical protein
MERLATGTVAADIENPTPPNCRTCHQIHTTYTDADFAFTNTAPVDLIAFPGETVDFGVGNLCASCHQARPIDPLPVLGGADVAVASTRYGTHHSPVATVLGGVGLFDLAGDVDGGPFVHGGSDVGCPTCHMAQPFGAQAGGHTMAMTYEYHGAEVDNVAGCMTSGCHSSVEDFGKFGVQDDVTAKLDELATLLRAKGIMAAAPSVSSVSGTFPADVAAAFVNWQTIFEDKSLGIHNPPYVLGILQGSIDAMN